MSHAFDQKKQDEIKTLREYQTSYGRGIILLLAISLLPAIVSVYFLQQGVELEQVLIRLPRLVLSIIPIYIPALWFTYSANKKLNLSKRLIEEYTHKEVLSKTYEGLSKQISGLKDPSLSEELRVKLLSSFLQISSENPGKLISNYNSSDHPVMEALEQSYKFQVAIDKLEAVPGLGKIAAIVESRTKKKIEEKEDKITEALTLNKPESK